MLLDARPSSTARRQPVHENVVSRLRDLIVEGELAPGTHIAERDLCARFGVSRTPLREALKALASEGLVTLLPNRGAVVAALTMKDVDDVMAVIHAIEGIAAPAACERASEAQIEALAAWHAEMEACALGGDLMGYFKLNQRVHEAIVDLADNAAASAIYRSLLLRIRRYRFVGNREGSRLMRALAEHGQILEALRARDGALLRQLLHSHLRNGWAVTRELVRDELEANARMPARVRRRPVRASPTATASAGSA